MKKRQLFIIAPAIFAFGALVGCKNNTTTYKVTFDYCYDGKQPDVVSVEANKSVNRPNEPTRENYRFVDWFTEKDYQNIYNFSSTVTKDFTLYAKWESALPTAFNLSEENATITVKEEHTLNITLTSGADPSNYDINWEIKDPTKLEQVSVSENKLEFKFKGKAETEELAPTEISVKVSAKGGSGSTTKSCFVTVDKELSEKEKFLKAYKVYSDTFQNSEKIYDAKDISIKLAGEEAKVATEISYEDKTEEHPRHCVINDGKNIAGGVYEYNTLKAELDEYEDAGATFEYIKEDKIAGIKVSYQGTLVIGYKFNSNGYITEYSTTGQEGVETSICIYSKDPRDKTEEEKFYDVYKVASKNFQKATKEYKISDVTCKVDGTIKTTISVDYCTENNVRSCTIKYDGQDTAELVAGKDFCYSDDPTEGIRAFIKTMEGMGLKTTYGSDKKTGEVTLTMGDYSYKFNKDGYVIVINDGKAKVEYIYND